ncbi:Ribosomal protein L50- mitochondria [Apiospora rasikravindrae]|uniref:Large ribosomal subunit protein mL50 n=1 Tax=Apiospora rasikravindrae TaxID=990691 RepID=A0ABR1TD10_9PEZI
MRRISRLGKPSGARLAPAARPLAPLGTPRASTRPSPTPAAVKINTLRFYSSRQPEPLPASLTSGGKSAAPEEIVEEVEVQQFDHDQSQQQRLFVPPPRPSVAERADTITDTLYTPATTAEGLESIGGLGSWWDDPAHWPETSDFVGFKPKQKVQEPVLLEAAVRRALTETLLMKQLGQEEQLTGPWGLQGKAQHDAVLALDVRVDSDGNATVTGDLHAVADGLVVKDGESNVDSADVLPSTAEALAWKSQADQSWKGTSLQDARLKFAVIKRVMQLTGQVIPDQKLADIATARGLLATLQKPPKPKTLSQEIVAKKQDLVTLPNVAFSPKRVTRGDKDQALGRYKLIEAEFRKRDLQDGPLSVPKSREKKHWNGEA